MLEDRLVGASPVTHRIEFFAKFFLEKKEKKQEKGGGRVRPKYYGQTLSEFEAFDRLRNHKAQREAKETKKKRQQKGTTLVSSRLSPRMLR